ncbi:unnamed protein product [Schistosoma mattheei]|uniref:Uncharacterized protein n=1 Tax=Schistosoma mattheei TaxID=31246 RepID=A0A183Q8P4_9TREM|nr:unnamed protein product [Schistosoma mattheei]
MSSSCDKCFLLSIFDHSTCYTYSRTARFNHSSTTIVNGVISNTDAGLRRAVQCLESSPSGSQISRRYTTENSVNLYSNSKPSVNGCVPKQSSSGKPVRERGAKEDPVTRYANLS